MRVVSIFGVTGSIGSQALDFIRSHNGIFSFHTFVCDKNFKLAKDLVDEFQPKYIYFSDKIASEEFLKFKISSTVVLQSFTELKNVLLSEKSDIYLSAISSSNLLELTSLAASSGGKLLLANKESLVVMGEQILNLSKQNETEIVPIDSEHYSVMNLLRNKDPRDVKKVYLTASGGPFLNKSIQEVANKSLEEALKHPTWEMGKKITIDSATLINKCFKIIEAHYLFDIPLEKLDILIHPQSKIHALVEYMDGSIDANISDADMIYPISYGFLGTINYELGKNELFSSSQGLDLNLVPFPEDRKFLIDIVKDVITNKGNRGLVFSTINDFAVRKYLDRKIGFGEIYQLLIKNYSKVEKKQLLAIEDIEINRSEIIDFLQKI